MSDLLRISEIITSRKYLKVKLALVAALHILFLSTLNFVVYGEFFVFPYLVESGLVPYKDIIDQHFPSLMLSPINFHSLGIRAFDSMLALHFSLILLNHALLYNCSKHLFDDEATYVLPNIVYFATQPLFEGYVFWIDSLLAPFVLTAVLFVLIIKNGNGRASTVVILGLLAEAAIFLKQTAAVVAFWVLILFIYKKMYKNVLIFLLGMILPLSVLFIYINGLYVWEEFYYWTITFNLTVYSKMARSVDMVSLIKFLPIIFTAAYISIVNISKKSIEFMGGLFLLFLIIILTWVPRMDFIHLQPAIPVASIIVGSGSIILDYKKIGVIILSLFIAYNTFAFISFNKFTHDSLYSNYDLLIENINKETVAGDTIYVRGVGYELYAFTNTLPPNNYFVYELPWYKQALKSKITSNILKSRPKLLVFRDNTIDENDILEMIKSDYQKTVRIEDINIYKKL